MSSRFHNLVDNVNQGNEGERFAQDFITSLQGSKDPP